MHTAINAYLVHVVFGTAIPTSLYIFENLFITFVNRGAKREVGEKMMACGKSARWWDSEVKDKSIQEQNCIRAC